MPDYRPPPGNLIQFGFFPVTIAEQSGLALKFDWAATSISYLVPPGSTVNFSLRRSPPYTAPPYDAVNFEIKNYSQSESSLSAILQDIKSTFVTIDPIRVTLALKLGAITPVISAFRKQAWAGRLAGVLANQTAAVTGRVPIRITATLALLLGNSVVVAVGRLDPTGRWSTVLSSVQPTITGKVAPPIIGGLARLLTNVTGQLTARHDLAFLIGTLAPTTGVWSGIVPLRITATMARLLVGVSTVAFRGGHTAGPWVGVWTSVTGLFTGIVPLRIIGTWSSTLGSVTVKVQSLHIYARGTLASTLINTAIIIRGGVVIPGRVALALAPVTAQWSIRVPIRITATLALNTAWVLRHQFIGRAWPTGRFHRPLTAVAVVVRGTLPVAITGVLSTNTMALQRPPFFRVFNVPAGRVSRLLDAVSTVFRLKVPIRITAMLGWGTAPVTTTVKIRAAIYAYMAAKTETVAIGWFLKYEKPRQGVLQSTMRLTGLFYAKISTHGALQSSLSPLQSSWFIRVPIRVFITLTLVLMDVAAKVIRGKVAIGGVMDVHPRGVTGSFFIRCLIGGNIQLTPPLLTALFHIRVPIRIFGSFHPSVLSVYGYITGRGHHTPVVAGKLESIKLNFTVRVWNVLGVMNIQSINGPFVTINKFYNASLGERYPYRSGKFWRLQIYGNNGHAAVTTFQRLALFKLNPDGTFEDVLANVASAQQFSHPNTEYATPTGMRWEHELPTDTEIRYYEVDGA